MGQTYSEFGYTKEETLSRHLNKCSGADLHARVMRSTASDFSIQLEKIYTNCVKNAIEEYNKNNP